MGRLAPIGQLGRADPRDVYVKPLEHRGVFHEAVDQPVITRHRFGGDFDLLAVK